MEHRTRLRVETTWAGENFADLLTVFTIIFISKSVIQLKQVSPIQASSFVSHIFKFVSKKSVPFQPYVPSSSFVDFLTD